MADKKRSLHPRRLHQRTSAATSRSPPAWCTDRIVSRTLSATRNAEVADGVDAGPHDGRRDPDDEAVDELLGEERRDHSCPTLDEKRTDAEPSKRLERAREVDAARTGVDDMDAYRARAKGGATLLGRLLVVITTVPAR